MAVDDPYAEYSPRSGPWNYTSGQLVVTNEWILSLDGPPELGSVLDYPTAMSYKKVEVGHSLYNGG